MNYVSKYEKFEKLLEVKETYESIKKDLIDYVLKNHKVELVDDKDIVGVGSLRKEYPDVATVRMEVGVKYKIDGDDAKKAWIRVDAPYNFKTNIIGKPYSKRVF